MKQQFNEDRAELEAHFYERVQAYVELGETPEQAKISAVAKFGETEVVLGQLRRRRARQSPVFWGAVFATGYILLTILGKVTGFNAFAHGAGTVFLIIYSIFLISGWKKPKPRQN